MLRLVVLLASALALPMDQPLPGDLPATNSSGNETLPEVDDRIVGGSSAKLGQFPYQAALYLKKSGGDVSFCGGALITPRYILTAAHCTVRTVSVVAYLGITNLQDKTGGVQVSATRSIMHPDYYPASVKNDIALVELSTAVPLTKNIQTISLGSDALQGGVPVTLIGWGRTSSAATHISSTLNYVQLTIITNSECSSTFENQIFWGNICAKGKTFQSTCNGDSGGPMVTGSGSNALHVGIVSFGSSKGCDKGYPTVYTRTASYRSWIRKYAHV